MALETYEGARSYQALSDFCKENLKPSCSPLNLSLCDDEKKKKIEKYQAMTEDELYEEITKVDDLMSEADAFLQAEIEKLQEKYQQVMSEVSDTKKMAKIEYDYGIMKAVMAMKKENIEG